MRWHKTIISIMVVMALVFVANAPSAIAVSVSSANGLVTISGDFFLTDWSPTCGTEVNVYERFRIPPAGQPPNCDGRFTEFVEPIDEAKESNFHFQILSGDGLCILLDVRLAGINVIAGDNNSYAFTLPIDEVLTCSSFNFLGSVYDKLDDCLRGFHIQGDFKLVPGEDYRFEIVDQITRCGGVAGSSNVGELLKDSETFTIPCCFGPTGNVDFDPDNNVDIADMTFLIDHLFINFPPLPCFNEADVIQDTIIDIEDLNFLIDHLFINLPPLADCP